MLWLARKKYKFQSKKQKVLVQLVTAQLAMFWVCVAPARDPSTARRGGSRCSVKPASRCVLHSRNQVTQNLRSGHRVHLLAWNGRDRYEPQHTRPSGALSTVQHFKALTWVKGSLYLTRRAKSQTGKIMKSWSFFVLSDMGLWWELWVFNCMFGCQEKWNLTPDASLENPLCLMRQTTHVFQRYIWL